MSCLATLAGGQAPVNEQPYRVELSVNQPTSRIGEPVTALLKLVGPPGVVSARPRVGKEIGDFEVVSLTASPPFDPGDGMTQSWTMVLTTFSSGTRVLGGIGVDGTQSDGQSFSTTVSNAVRVVVATPSVNADDELLPLTGPLTGPDPSSQRRRLTAVLVATLAVGGMLASALRLWRWRARQVACRAFWRALHDGLSGSAKESTGGPLGVRERHARVSSILRQAVAQAVERPIHSMTSGELTAAVRGTAGCEPLAEDLETVLATVDEIRFGGWRTRAAEYTRTLEDADRLLSAIEAAARQRKGPRPA